MKQRHFSRTLIVAVTMIATLLLIIPVCLAYEQGGGDSGGSTSSASHSEGSSEVTYATTTSSGTYTSTGSGLHQAQFTNSLPISSITVKLSSNAPDQFPTCTVSYMSDSNTKKLIQSVQETPGQGAIINGGQIPTSSTTSSTQGKGETDATDTSIPASKAKQKIVPITGNGVKYDITPDTFAKLEYNYQYSTTIPQGNKTSGHVIIRSHTIKTGVGFRL